MAATSIGNYKKQQIPVADLQLDLENFRTGTVKNQTEALSVLINRSASKLRGLASSISENGFLDLEIPCVFPDSTKSGKYVVAEGNRRVSALKMLRVPELAKNTPLMAEIKKLKDTYKPKLPTRIECAVFGSKKDCLAYILMRHGYGTDGAGVIQWNSISKLRADTYVNGTIHQELRVLEFVADKGVLSSKRQQVIDDDELNITNLSRITDDANVRAQLNIVGTDCTNSLNGDIWLVKIWQRILEIIIDGEYNGEKFTVDKNINNTAQRQQFINEIIAGVHPVKGSATGASTVVPPTSGRGPRGAGTGTGAAKGVGTSSSSGKSQPTRARKSLVPKGFNPSGLKPQKVVNICDELKTLEVDKFPHCAGAMFRILVEFGTENYISLNPTIIPKNDKLVSKITSVADYMKSNKILTPKQLKPVNDIISKASHPISTETLNAYVHNPHVSPSADTLKAEWDNIQHFIELLWHN